MTTVKEFFRQLNHDIAHAQTTKTLRILDRHAKNFLLSVKGPMISKAVKKEAARDYKKSKKLMKQLSKSLAE